MNLPRTTSTTNRPTSRPKVDAGVRAILLYKYIKGGVELGVAVVLVLLLVSHETQGLYRLAAHIRHHMTAAWSIKVADTVLAGASPHGVLLTALALHSTGRAHLRRRLGAAHRKSVGQVARGGGERRSLAARSEGIPRAPARRSPVDLPFEPGDRRLPGAQSSARDARGSEQGRAPDQDRSVA